MQRFLFLMVIVSMLFAGCSKSETDGVTYKGVVIYNVCGNVVVQSLGADNIGQESWTDINNVDRPVYKHVFKVSNPCQFGNHSYGDTINFEIIAPQVQRCAQCLLYLATPDTAYPIHVDE